MILELDVGNTRLKWRLLDDAGARCAGGALAFDPALPPPWAPARPERARVSSVAGAARDAALGDWLAAQGVLSVTFARSEASRAGVRNGYRQPAALGVDRWLALLAARALGRHAWLVVDAGSAITVDVLDADGLHGGGWIVPGLTMMRDTLLRGTAGIRFEPGAVEQAAWPGDDTAAAVQRGALCMAGDFILARHAALRDRAGDARWCLTGGDAGLLASHFRRQAPAAVEGLHEVPELVLDGLVLALN